MTVAQTRGGANAASRLARLYLKEERGELNPAEAFLLVRVRNKAYQETGIREPCPRRTYELAAEFERGRPAHPLLGGGEFSAHPEATAFSRWARLGQRLFGRRGD